MHTRKLVSISTRGQTSDCNDSLSLLGETKECTEFAKQFLERRSKYKNQQRAANAHIDDMCSPAPAITPSNDFQEVKVSFTQYFIGFFPTCLSSFLV